MRRPAKEESRCRRGTGGGGEREADTSAATWGIRLSERGDTQHSYDASISSPGKRNK